MGNMGGRVNPEAAASRQWLAGKQDDRASLDAQRLHVRLTGFHDPFRVRTMIPLSLVVMLRVQDNTQSNTQDNNFTEAGSYASPD